MIITIGEQVADSLDLSDKAVLCAISNIFMAYKEGKHYVMFTQRLYDIIYAASEQFSADVWASVRNSAAQQFYLNKCFAECVVYVSVVLDGNIDKIQKNDKLVIKVPLSYYCDSESIQKTSFIVENLNDADVYKVIGDVYCEKYNLPDSLVFSPINGGGDTTGDVFSRCQVSQKNPIFCMVDNDKMAPEVDVGDTAKKVERNVEPKCVSSAKIIKAHSVESLIPASIYRMIYGVDANKIDVVEKYLKIDELFPGLRPYIKFRQGILCSCNQKKPAVKKFWEGVEGDVRRGLNLSSKCCMGAEVCEIIPGLGDRVVPRVIEQYKRMSKKEIWDTVKDVKYLDECWLDIGREIFSWCCAPHPTYLN